MFYSKIELPKEQRRESVFDQEDQIEIAWTIQRLSLDPPRKNETQWFGNVLLQTGMERHALLCTLTEQQNHKCCWCGKRVNVEDVKHESVLNDDPTRLPHDRATFEHIIPKIKGGTDSISNLAISCSACNQRRGSTLFWHYTPVTKPEYFYVLIDQNGAFYKRPYLKGQANKTSFIRSATMFKSLPNVDEALGTNDWKLTKIAYNSEKDAYYPAGGIPFHRVSTRTYYRIRIGKRFLSKEDRDFFLVEDVHKSLVMSNFFTANSIRMEASKNFPFNMKIVKCFNHEFQLEV